MLRAKRFVPSIAIEVEVIYEVISHDDYLLEVFGLMAEMGTMRHWFLLSIVSQSQIEDDYYFWKWAERTMSELEFSNFCNRHEKSVARHNALRLRAKRKAFAKGYISLQEYTRL